MRIALLSDGIYPFILGGMQKHSYNLIKYLSLEGHSVILYHSVAEKDVLPDSLMGFSDIELTNIKHKSFHFPNLDKLPGHYLRESYQLSKQYREQLLLEKESIDLIYAQGFMAWALFKEGKGNINAPVVVNFHGMEMFQKAASIKMKLEHYLLRPSVLYNLRKADKVISLGGKLTALLSKYINNDKILINSIGIESVWLDEHLSENKIRKFVFIGRNERRKGIKELYKALSNLVDEVFELHIIGPFNAEDKITDNRISYYGEIKDQNEIAAILRDMDVLVLPSWSEGMPTVILEAMAKSCAIIATDVGAVSKLVDESNGWLCLPGNIPSLQLSFSNALSCSVKELNAKKKHSIQKVKESYTWDRVILDLISKIEPLKKK